MILLVLRLLLCHEDLRLPDLHARSGRAVDRFASATLERVVLRIHIGLDLGGRGPRRVSCVRERLCDGRFTRALASLLDPIFIVHLVLAYDEL